jgi:uncharacterized coiled-coil DUF342 family protein
MSRYSYSSQPTERLAVMEKASGLRREVDDFRYQRQRLIADIKEKRNRADDLKKKRDALNAEVKRLVGEGKEHVKKRDAIQEQIKKLKGKRAEITQDIAPKAKHIRSEKEIRDRLNRAARASPKELKIEFDASLKTLFGMDLTLRQEVIMVEMVMEVQRRFLQRKDADELSTDIHQTWEDIKGIEEKASTVTFKIMSLAADNEKEHQAAMDCFDRKREVSEESQEHHQNFIALMKEVRGISKEIDDISRKVDGGFKKLRPLERNLDSIRLTRRDQQRLEQLKVAKQKMATTGKIGLEDLKILMESKALDLSGGKGGKGGNEGKGREKKGKKK